MTTLSSTSFTVDAPAKLNLFLHITGKRADNYHLIQSMMVFVDKGDKLTFSPYDGLFIDVDGPFAHGLAANPQDNLIYKAAKLLAQEYGVQPKGHILLTKNLPLASGLAGGSADAAAALHGLVKLWRLPEESSRLQRIARQLGADVPACLTRRPVWAEGIGENITYLQGVPKMHFVIVNPLMPTPTPQVFANYREKFSPALQFSGRRKSMQEWIADLKKYRNDLTNAAQHVTPLIGDTLRALENSPNCRFARLSGSGASCFGVYDTPSGAQAAVNKLAQDHPRWWVTAADLLIV